MDIQNIKLLAEIGVLGSNQGLTKDAESIFSALRLSHQGEQVSVTTTALNFYNKGDFPQAAKTLSAWCEQNPPHIPHALLALVYWSWGYNVNAEAYAKEVLANTQEVSARALAENVLNEMGVSY